jgi:hypothetical protein
MKLSVVFKLGCCLLVAIVLHLQSIAQNTRSLTKDNSVRTEGGTQVSNFDSQGRPIGNRASTGNDSLQKRDQFADSITIYFRYFDSSRNRFLDSNVNDFAKRFAQPYWYINLGNYGTASKSLLFRPILKAGWDAGFHQFDVYNFSIEDTRFFQTTRPYTELAYILGSKSEQTINFLHTQNKKSNLNFAFEYRFINSPGSFKNQNSNHNNIRFNLSYQTPNKRYGAYLIWVSNKNISSENGGLRDAAKLDSLSLNNPYELETRLGASGSFSQNPFNTKISTGNQYKNNNILYRHYYDFGKRDSIVTDSSTIQLFYPRLRFQHTFKLNNYDYTFIDNNVVDSNYRKYFGFQLNSTSQKNLFQNKWAVITNELSIITFPEKNNLRQFLKLGAVVQNITGTQGTFRSKDYNLYFTGEYRNRTRNQIWDIEASGSVYVNGLNAGNYEVLVSLKRLLSKQIGFLELGFQNVNKTPSLIYNSNNNFLVVNNGMNKNENTIRLFAGYENPKQDFKLSGEYYLLNNFTYFDSFFQAKQTAQLFNVLHIAAEKKFKLAKHFNWYTEVHLQQTTSNAPVNIPFILTRNRIVFEGNFYTNLFLSTGLEIKYYTNYKADNYSPFTGQFFYQNSFTTANRPQIDAFMHFRIKSFKAYVRLENMNTLIGGKGKYNFNAFQYAANALWFRTGIYWNFVN